LGIARNEAKKMRNYIILLLIVFASQVMAQRSTFSPYSIYGLGEPSRSNTTALSSMGHVSAAISDATIINSTNPASYTDITRPSFSFDLKNELLSINSGNTSQASNSFSIQNFSFAFPIINDFKKHKRRMGVSFGLTPISNMGYDLYDAETIPDLGQIEYRFFGDGGINSLHTGTGFDILANEKRTNLLSAGGNLNYVFGSISQNRATEIERSAAATNLFRQTSQEISAVDWNIGIRASHIDTIVRNIRINDSTFQEKTTLILMSLGAYVRPGADLNTFTQTLEYTYSDSFNNPNIVDTLLEKTANGTTSSPLAVGVGISLNIGNKWVLTTDYSRTMWSQLTINGKNANLSDAQRISLGAQYIPEFDKRESGNYLKVVRYRAGFSFGQTMLNVNGQQPIIYGMTAGLGFPLFSASSSNSIFNIGAEVARRQTSATSLTENYFNIYAGFTITPHKYDQWFAKRKYD
jgi:hypothetical protein